MNNTIVYNYSGANQTLGGVSASYIVPPGGPFVFPAGEVSSESGLIIEVGGGVQAVTIQPDLFADFEYGFLFGLSLSVAIVLVRLLKMARARPPGV